LAIAAEMRRREFERDTVHAYQVVRIGLMVKRSKSGRVTLPKIDECLGKKRGATLEAGDPHEKGRAFLQMVAARTGSKVRKVTKR
jgi:hypothetical protein